MINFYRYIDGPDNVIQLLLCKFIRETEHSWFVDDFGQERRIGKDWQKRYAEPTVAAAKISFIKRKQKQINILEAQLVNAESQLSIAEKGNFATIDDPFGYNIY